MSHTALMTTSHQDIFLPKDHSSVNTATEWLALRSSLLSMISQTHVPQQLLIMKHHDLRQPAAHFKWIQKWIDKHAENNDPIEFMGFAGTDKNCEYRIHGQDANSKIDAVDSIIYKHAGKIHMKRLNHAPELRQNAVFNSDINFYNQEFKNLHKRIGSQLALTPEQSQQNSGSVEVHDHPLLNKVMHYKQTMLVKRTGGRSPVNMTSAVDGANFELRIPGSDEIANLTKESVKNLPDGLIQGLALPLAQLGIIGLFYPLVSLGADVMKHEYHEAKEELLNLEEEFDVKRQNLTDIKEQLKTKIPDTAQKLEKFLTQYENPQKVKVKKIKTDVHQLSEEIFHSLLQQSDPASQTILRESLLNLDEFVKIQLERKLVILKKTEFRLDKTSLQGMLTALKLFIAYGTSSVIKYLAPYSAYKALTITGEVLNGAALGVMGISQLGVMLSGLYKSATGLLKFKTMQSNRQKIEALAENMGNQAAKIALQRYSLLQKKQALIEMLSKTVPGTTLSIGQAAMAAWSIASFGFLVSGVGSPVGVGMMLGLLVPGVVLTLAASAPKIGLGAVLNRYKHKHFAEDTTVSKSQLMHLQLQNYVEKDPAISTKELLTNISQDFTIADRRVQYIELLQNSKDMGTQHRLQELENAMGVSNSKNAVDVVAMLDENNATAEFVSKLYNKHRKELDVFKRENITVKVEANRVTKRNFYKPKVLWHSNLRHRDGTYTQKHKIVQLDYQLLSQLNHTQDKALVFDAAFKVMSQNALQKSRSMRDALGQGLVALSEITQIQDANQQETLSLERS